MIDVRSLNITKEEIDVSMRIASAFAQITEDACKQEKVEVNAGITGVCIALFMLAKKHGVRIETLVEVLREMGRDASKQATA